MTVQMKRLWCFLGFHSWVGLYRMKDSPIARRCRRCLAEDWWTHQYGWKRVDARIWSSVP